MKIFNGEVMQMTREVVTAKFAKEMQRSTKVK